jgi:hypothetical protein
VRRDPEAQGPRIPVTFTNSARAKINAASISTRQLSGRRSVESVGDEIMKKLLLIAFVAGGLVLGEAPRSDAGVSVGIGFGFPLAYPYPAYPYPYGFYAPSFYAGPSFYWNNGHRVFVARGPHVHRVHPVHHG